MRTDPGQLQIPEICCKWINAIKLVIEHVSIVSEIDEQVIQYGPISEVKGVCSALEFGVEVHVPGDLIHADDVLATATSVESEVPRVRSVDDGLVIRRVVFEVDNEIVGHHGGCIGQQ